MLRSCSFLNRTVCTPEMAFTTVDFPWATWPMVPMLMVACRAIISGVNGESVEVSMVEGSGCSGRFFDIVNRDYRVKTRAKTRKSEGCCRCCSDGRDDDNCEKQGAMRRSWRFGESSCRVVENIPRKEEVGIFLELFVILANGNTSNTGV